MEENMHSSNEQGHVHCDEHKHLHGGEHTNADNKVHADETTALLSYMVKHNVHHEEELKELSASLQGENLDLLNEALEDFHAGNDKLRELLNLMENK